MEIFIYIYIYMYIYIERELSERGGVSEWERVRVWEREGVVSKRERERERRRERERERVRGFIETAVGTMMQTLTVS